jgi:small-conductance mechanosensitive channel
VLQKIHNLDHVKIDLKLTTPEREREGGDVLQPSFYSDIHSTNNCTNLD